MKTLVAALLIAAAQVGAPQQPVPQQTPRATVRGVVAKWGSSDPLQQAIVELRAEASGRPVASTATSEKGEFVLRDAPAGRYRVVATLAGYASAEYGQRRPGGAGHVITLSPAEQRTGIQISMPEGATVFGRVLDRKGQPLAFTDVRVEKLEYRGGRPGLVTVQSTVTNDLGEYRMFWITPGQYYVRAAANNFQNFAGTLVVNPNGADTGGVTFGSTAKTAARVTGAAGLEEGELFVPIYYPGNSDVQNASLVELRAGARMNANFLVTPVRVRQVRGVVVDQSTGQPFQGAVSVSMFPVDRYLQPGGSSNLFTPNNGAFQFSNMRPGSYELSATVAMPVPRGEPPVASPAGDLAGRLLVDVADRDASVTLRVQPVAKLGGTIRFEGQQAADIPANPAAPLQLAIRGAMGQFTANVSANGNFEIPKVPAGGYQIGVLPFAPLSELPILAGIAPAAAQPRPRPSLPAIWQDAYVKSIRVGDLDLSSTDLAVEGQAVGPVEITVGFDGGSLTGRALDSKQQPVANASVVLIPNGPPPIRSDRYRFVLANESGEFQFRGITPGDYNLYSWEDVDAGSWFNPAFMRLHEPAGQQIRIGAAQKQTADVHAIPVP